MYVDVSGDMACHPCFERAAVLEPGTSRQRLEGRADQAFARCLRCRLADVRNGENIFPTLEWTVGLAPNIYQQYAAASAGYALAGVVLHLLLTATGLCRVKVRDVPAPHLNEKAKTWASAAFAAALFLFNFVRIFDNNFWGDEAFSIRLAQMSVRRCCRRRRRTCTRRCTICS